MPVPSPFVLSDGCARAAMARSSRSLVFRNRARILFRVGSTSWQLRTEDPDHGYVPPTGSRLGAVLPGTEGTDDPSMSLEARCPQCLFVSRQLGQPTPCLLHVSLACEAEPAS